MLIYPCVIMLIYPCVIMLIYPCVIMLIYPCVIMLIYPWMHTGVLEFTSYHGARSRSEQLEAQRYRVGRLRRHRTLFYPSSRSEYDIYIYSAVYYVIWQVKLS